MTDGYEYFDDDGDTVHQTVLVFDQYGVAQRVASRSGCRTSPGTRLRCVDQWGGLKTYTTGRRSGSVRVPYTHGDVAGRDAVVEYRVIPDSSGRLPSLPTLP